MEILDYKTDHNVTAQQLAELYRDQLLLYAYAIGSRFGQPVTKLTIYSFSLGQEVDIPVLQPGENIQDKFKINP